MDFQLTCASLSLEESFFQVAEVWFLHLPNDHFARPDVNTADPLSLVNHHAFGNCIDSAAIEIGHARRPKRRYRSTEAAAQLLQLQVHWHRRDGGVLVRAGQE